MANEIVNLQVTDEVTQANPGEEPKRVILGTDRRQRRDELHRLYTSMVMAMGGVDISPRGLELALEAARRTQEHFEKEG